MISMMDTGMMVNLMDKENSFFMMGLFMRVIGCRISVRVMVFTKILMDINIKDSGLEIFKMVKE